MMITEIQAYWLVIVALVVALAVTARLLVKAERRTEQLARRTGRQRIQIQHLRDRIRGYLDELDALTPQPAPPAEPTPLIGDAFDLSASVLADLRELPSTYPGDRR